MKIISQEQEDPTNKLQRRCTALGGWTGYELARDPSAPLQTAVDRCALSAHHGLIADAEGVVAQQRARIGPPAHGRARLDLLFGRHQQAHAGCVRQLRLGRLQVDIADIVITRCFHDIMGMQIPECLYKGSMRSQAPQEGAPGMVGCPQP